MFKYFVTYSKEWCDSRTAKSVVSFEQIDFKGDKNRNRNRRIERDYLLQWTKRLKKKKHRSVTLYRAKVNSKIRNYSAIDNTIMRRFENIAELFCYHKEFYYTL